MFSFGFFYNLEEMTELSLPLVELLDGQRFSNPCTFLDLLLMNVHSFSSDRLNPNAKGISDESNKKRFEKNDLTWMIMESKLEICHILNMICDIRLDIRLTEILCIYKMKYQEIDRSDMFTRKKSLPDDLLPPTSPSYLPSNIPTTKDSLLSPVEFDFD
jgi:hypothetical protein